MDKQKSEREKIRCNSSKSSLASYFVIQTNHLKVSPNTANSQIKTVHL